MMCKLSALTHVLNRIDNMILGRVFNNPSQCPFSSMSPSFWEKRPDAKRHCALRSKALDGIPPVGDAEHNQNLSIAHSSNDQLVKYHGIHCFGLDDIWSLDIRVLADCSLVPKSLFINLVIFFLVFELPWASSAVYFSLPTSTLASRGAGRVLPLVVQAAASLKNRAAIGVAIQKNLRL